MLNMMTVACVHLVVACSQRLDRFAEARLEGGSEAKRQHVNVISYQAVELVKY